MTLATVLVSTMSEIPVFASPTPPLAGPIAAGPIVKRCPPSRPDEFSAAQAARWCNDKVEVSSRLSGTTKVWALPEGGFEAEVYGGPIRMERNGAWVDVDLTLAATDDGSIAPKAHPYGLKLSGAQTGTGAHDLVALGEGADRNVLGWLGRLPKPTLAGTNATYPDVRPGVDLVLEVTRTGVEQFLVVKDRAGLASVGSITMPWQTGNRTPVKTADGSLELRDGKNAAVRMPAAMMWDATVDPKSGDPARRAPVALSVKPGKSKSSSDLTLTPNADFLRRSDLKFPVTIDPYLELGAAFDAFIQTGYTSDQSGTTDLRLGTYDSGTNMARTMMRFDGLSSIAGATVTYANLNLWEWHAWSCTASQWESWQTDWPDTWARWTNQANWYGPKHTSTETQGAGSGTCGDNWVHIPVTDIIQTSATNGWNSAGIGLKATNESDSNSWKKFNSSNASSGVPHIKIWYTAPAALGTLSTLPATVTAGGVSYVASRTPTLQAVVMDPDGGLVNASFEWRPTGGSTTGVSVNNLASGATASTVLPQLAEGGSYEWRVRATDTASQSSPWSAWQPITIDSTKPGSPIVTTKDGKYPSTAVDNTWGHGGYGQAGTFTVTPASPSGDLASFSYQLDGQSTPTVVSATAAVDIVITPSEDGVRTLTVTATDKADNQSNPTTYAFNVGRAGLSQPRQGDSVVLRTRLAIAGDATFTRTTFQYRRGNNAPTRDIPWSNLTTGQGQSINATPGVPVDLTTLGSGAVWNALDTLGTVGGVVQVRATLYPAGAGASYATQWVSIAVDPSAAGAATSPVGPGTVNLLTGDHSLSATDAEQADLSVSRVAESRNPAGGWVAQGERLTVNQQQVSTDTSGFGGQNATVFRATTLGQGGSSDSLELRPLASGGTIYGPDGATFADLGGDYGAMRLGMQAGKRYRITGWIYVPRETGLNPKSTDGLSIAAVYNAGGYNQVQSPRASFVDGWQQLSVDVALPSNTTEAFIRLFNGFPTGNNTKAVWWDNLSVRELIAPFGPEWSGGARDAAGGSDYTTLEFPAADLVKINTVDGEYITFGKSSTGIYNPEPGNETMSLVAIDATHFQLKDIDGTVVEFTKQVSPPSFVVTSSWNTQGTSTTRYAYDLTDSRTLVKRVIAPTPSGVGDCFATTPAKGCRIVEYDYAATTTATAGTFGDIKGQVRAVKFWSWDQAASAVNSIEIARYAYDTQGRLREVWDPRPSTPLKTAYEYDAVGRITKVTQPGQLPWSFEYGTISPDAVSQVGSPYIDWRMDETTGTSVADSSGNGRTGTAANTTVGAGGGSNDVADVGRVFNGTSSVVTGPTTGPNTTQSFTVSAWVQLKDDGSYRTAVGKDGSTLAAFQLYYEKPQNKWGFAMQSCDCGSPLTATALSSETAVLGQWTHLTGVYDQPSNTLKLYVNGVFQSQATRLGTAWNATGAVTAGAAKGGGYWTGGIDDVRVYQSVLSSGDIGKLAATRYVDTNAGYLYRTRRSSLVQGSLTQTGPETITRVVYRVPLTRAAGGPVDVDATTAAGWGQSEPPTDATAIFGAADDPTVVKATSTTPGQNGYGPSAVHYLNSSGREVNTATETAQGIIGANLSTTQYDQFGNEVWSLDARSRLLVLGQNPGAAATMGVLGLSGLTDPAQAQALAKISRYSPDGTDLLEETGPTTVAMLAAASGSYSAGTEVVGRTRTIYTYDEGKPDGATYHLVTTESTGLRLGGVDADVRVTKTEYDWAHSQPTKSIVDPAGLALATRTEYDAAGRTIRQTNPAGGASNTTPSTRVTVYYSTTANATYPQCGLRPEWDGLICLTEPGGQPGSGAQLPTITMTYDRYGQPVTRTESNSGGVQRTITTSYDAAGRASTVSTTSNVGVAVETRRIVYDTTTGAVTKVQTLNGDSTVTGELTTVFDKLGRQASFTDADANVSTTAYDWLGRPAVTNDGKATRTYTYDGPNEQRGLPTAVSDSNVGQFTGVYDNEGTLVSQNWPNGVVVTSTKDARSVVTALTYTQPGCGQSDCTLYTESVQASVHGQTLRRTSSLSSQSFGYDKAARLVSVADTVTGACSTRSYAFDTATNRTGLTTYGPGAGGVCQTTTPATSTTWTVDTADRLTTSGYTYDSLGRTLTMPGQDSAVSGGSAVTNTYYVNDMVRSIQQGSRTTVYTMDVMNERIRSWTDDISGTAVTKVNHYASANGDSPAWTDEGDGLFSRVSGGLGGTAAIHTAASGPYWVITNLNGDFVAGMAVTGYGLAYASEYTENGLPRNTSDAGTRRYGWLGASQRAADTPGGLTLMGARLYAPGSGRFLSTDPVYGGNNNPYEYGRGDAIGNQDTTGKVSCSRYASMKSWYGWGVFAGYTIRRYYRCKFSDWDVRSFTNAHLAMEKVLSWMSAFAVAAGVYVWPAFLMAGVLFLMGSGLGYIGSMLRDMYDDYCQKPHGVYGYFSFSYKERPAFGKYGGPIVSRGALRGHWPRFKCVRFA